MGKLNFPVGGNIRRFKENWKCLSSDRFIAKLVEGAEIPLWTVPVQEREPRPFNSSEKQKGLFWGAIKSLWEKEVVEISQDCPGQFVSNVFIRPKPNGKVRLILDLAKFNDFVIKEHFKMESLQLALDLVKRGTSMASIDLQDAYFSIPVAQEFRKYLKFRWDDKLFQFTCLPMGLTCAPKMFTKLLAPVFAEIRKRGGKCVAFLDDSLVLGYSEEECRKSVSMLKNFLDNLGFKIHPEKSVMVPTKRIRFLGFWIDSETMTVSLPGEKVLKMEEECKDLLIPGSHKIQTVASLVGLMNSYSGALDYAENHRKFLERDKIFALAENKGNFDEAMVISKKGKRDILWWLEQAAVGVREIKIRTPEFTLITDASGLGWGAVVGEKTAQGRWQMEENELSINAKELLAVYFGLKTLC